MSNRNRRGNRQPPRGEFWLLVAVAVLLSTIGLLHLAVERERAAGRPDVQLLGSRPIGNPNDVARSYLKDE